MCDLHCGYFGPKLLDDVHKLRMVLANVHEFIIARSLLVLI